MDKSLQKQIRDQMNKELMIRGSCINYPKQKQSKRQEIRCKNTEFLFFLSRKLRNYELRQKYKYSSEEKVSSSKKSIVNTRKEKNICQWICQWKTEKYKKKLQGLFGKINIKHKDKSLQRTDVLGSLESELTSVSAHKNDRMIHPTRQKLFRSFSLKEANFTLLHRVNRCALTTTCFYWFTPNTSVSSNLNLQYKFSEHLLVVKNVADFSVCIQLSHKLPFQFFNQRFFLLHSTSMCCSVIHPLLLLHASLQLNCLKSELTIFVHVRILTDL